MCLEAALSALQMKSGEFITAASDPESLVEQLLSTQLDSSLPRSAAAEQRSWRNSLPVLAEDLAAAGLMDVDVFLEFPLPMSSQRIDALLAVAAPQGFDQSLSTSAPLHPQFCSHNLDSSREAYISLPNRLD